MGIGQDAGHVLIVEDDAPIRRLVKTALERSGFTIETAADGLEAVLKLGISEFDAIVLDLMMPNLDGFTVLQTLSEHRPALLRKIIVASAASPSVITERLKHVPFDFIAKPFDLDELVVRVRACVQARGA